MTQNKTQKTEIRQRMAETGEPYSVARHAVERDRDQDGAVRDGALGDSAPWSGGARTRASAGASECRRAAPAGG